MRVPTETLKSTQWLMLPARAQQRALYLDGSYGQIQGTVNLGCRLDGQNEWISSMSLFVSCAQARGNSSPGKVGSLSGLLRGPQLVRRWEQVLWGEDVGAEKGKNESLSLNWT